jgi:mycothiol synthase
VVSGVRWRALDQADLPTVAALAARCHAVDGGLPLATTEAFLARRYAADGVVGMAVLDATGALIAVIAVRPQSTITGLVDPSWRGLGLGTRLLTWARQRATAPVTVESESLTGTAAALFTASGLRQVFAEDVLRFDLAATPLPEVPLPSEVHLAEWTEDLSHRFHATYHESFRERPGFPDWPAARWIDWISTDPDFSPTRTLLATATDLDAGFIAAAEGWIVQVGVRPDWRGRGLGAALVVEVLRRMRDAGDREALLDVNVNNPAGELYRRLGFAPIGRRARWS